MCADKKSETRGRKGSKGQEFETSLKRLEQIVSDMEAGTLSLDDMVARFEEGQTLIKFCTRKLNEVERKIEVLVKKGDAVETEPLDENADQAGGGTEPAETDSPPDEGGLRPGQGHGKKHATDLF